MSQRLEATFYDKQIKDTSSGLCDRTGLNFSDHASKNDKLVSSKEVIKQQITLTSSYMYRGESDYFVTVVTHLLAFHPLLFLTLESGHRSIK